MIYLQWYRDKGNGQRAADCLDVIQRWEGSWPVARLVCHSHGEADILWWAIYKLWGVNSHTHDCEASPASFEHACG